MNRILFYLVFSILAASTVVANAADDSEAGKMHLSMAGALISDWCERNWQTSEYISIHACNYQFAQLYNLDISTRDFSECVAITTGDIVKIADCMVYRFNAWLPQAQNEETATSSQ